MKKLLTLSALILSAALVFMGCQQPEVDTDPYGDCKDTVNSVVLSDGIWSVNSKGRSTMFNRFSGDMEFNAKATAANGDYNYTSGTMKFVMKTSDILGDSYSQFTALPADQKEQFYNQYTTGMKTVFENYIGTVTNAKMDENNLTINVTLNETMLANTKQGMSLTSFSSGTTIKTNSNKTKYIINTKIDNRDITIKLSKD